MTTIRLHNTRTRTKEDFVPLDPSNVRMYVCGPTVYDRAHLGNGRPVVVFDVLFRLLRHVYGEGAVKYARNFTDVDDRINETAQKRRAAGAEGSLEDLIHQRTEETIGWYHADMDALGNLRPSFEPRATEYIGGMIAMIEQLMKPNKNGIKHAYEVAGHVLFKVRSFPEYGRLSGRSVDDMIAGARVEVAPYKDDPMDFVLWKPSDASLPGWESPWGRGRPGWHIECSAMSYELLGASFDIHGGGIDLQFPHHENEIAQSCCALGADFARVWMHNEMLMVEGRKMSKSLGNFFTVRDLLDQGVPGEVIRYVMLMTHYRSPMDWTKRKASDAQAAIAEMAGMLGLGGQEVLSSLSPGEPMTTVVAALAEDLNTSLALSILRRSNLKRDLGVIGMRDAVRDIYASQLLLGFDLRNHPSAQIAARFHDGLIGALEQTLTVGYDPVLGPIAGSMRELRESAKISGDFSKVDALKSALIAAGVEVRMSKSGVELVPGPGFDPAKLEGLT